MVVVMLALSGCAAIALFGGQLSVPYNDLNSRIGQRFPMERNVADLLTVTLMRPRVAAILPIAEKAAENNAARLSVTVDLQVKLPSLLNSSQRTLWGTMTLSGVPRYEPKSKAIVLVGASLVRVRVDSMPDALSAALAKAATQLAGEYLDNKPIYLLNATDVARLGLDNDRSALSLVILADRLVIAKR